MMIALVVLIQYPCVTDGQTDRQTDIIFCMSVAPSIHVAVLCWREIKTSTNRNNSIYICRRSSWSF